MDNTLLRTGSKIITTVGYESIRINEEKGIWDSEKEQRFRCIFGGGRKHCTSFSVVACAVKLSPKTYQKVIN